MLIWSVPYYSHTTNMKRNLFIDSYCMSLCQSIVHVPSMLAKGIETFKQTQQTSSHNGLEISLRCTCTCKFPKLSKVLQEH